MYDRMVEFIGSMGVDPRGGGQKRFLSDTHASLSVPAVNLVANWQRKSSVEWRTETDTGTDRRKSRKRGKRGARWK